MAKKKASRTATKEAAAARKKAVSTSRKTKKKSASAKKGAKTRSTTRSTGRSGKDKAAIRAITPEPEHESEILLTRGGSASTFHWEDEESTDANSLGSEEEFEFVPLADFQEDDDESMTRGGGEFAGVEKRQALQPELQRLLEKAAGPATRKKLGAEDRHQVADPRQYPFSAVCCLEMRRGSSRSFSIGTGFLVGRNLLLTAGHNLIHNPIVGRPDRVNIYPGRIGRNGTWSDVQEVAGPRQFWISDPWRARQDKTLDWAFIILKQPLYKRAGSFGLIPWEKFSPLSLSLSLNTSGFMVLGYPSSTVSDSPNRANPFTLWYDVGKVSRVGQRTLLYGMDTSEGQSGAPLIAWDSSKTSTGNTICVGIHNYGLGGTNQATRVTPALIQQVAPYVT